MQATSLRTLPALRCLAMAVLLGAALAGCSTTLPVEGSFEARNDRFLGEVTRSAGGQGRLLLQTLDGVRCSGDFAFAGSRVQGNGTLSCSDGRSGTFLFTANSSRGNGFGKLSDGELFSFRFGNPGYIRQQEMQLRPAPVGATHPAGSAPAAP